MNKIIIPILLFLVILIGFVIYCETKNKDTNNNTMNKSSSTPNISNSRPESNKKNLGSLLGMGENYLTPKDYEVGLIKDKPFVTSNLCNTKRTAQILYPIQQLDVEYGSKIPDSCPCTQFIQPP